MTMGSGIDAKAAGDWKSTLRIPAVEVVDLSSEDTVEQPDDETTRDALESKSSEDDANEDADGDGDDDDDWSIYEELINTEESEGEPNKDITDGFTPEESLALRKRLRLIGGESFFDETVGNGSIKAKKLITAFGIRPPAFLEGCPDVLYCKLLNLGIARELSKRVKLPQYNTLDDAVSLLKSAKNIIVLTGAGISTSLGIPDFRSKETGLYARLAHLGLSDPQEVFDISLFREDPSIFYSVAKDMLPPSPERYSPTHAFIRLLQDRDKLLTNFTQNIDNLESAAGIRPEKLIQCHGSFATATCIECGHHVPGASIHKDLAAGVVSRCEACVARIRELQQQNKIHTSSSSSSSPFSSTNNKKRKRDPASSTSHKKKPPSKKNKKKRPYASHFDSSSSSDSSDEESTQTAGIMKPDITFFGEPLPSAFHDRLLSHDRDIVDLVIVIGTSLKVAPVSEVVGVLPAHVPQVYISREACAHAEFDVDLLGDCDVVVAELCRRAGWALRHEMVEEEEGEGEGEAGEVEEEEGEGEGEAGEVEVELVEGCESRYRIRRKGGGEGKRKGG